MAGKKASVWTSISFWRRSAAWVTGFATILLIWLTFDTMAQIRMGTDEELAKGNVGCANPDDPHARLRWQMGHHTVCRS